jgi:uncharacterized protein (DUF2267 family)
MHRSKTMNTEETIDSRAPAPSDQAETRESFYRAIERAVPIPEHLSTESAVKLVMGRLFERLTAGESQRVLHALPEAWREFFRPIIDLLPAWSGVWRRTEYLDRLASELRVTPLHAEAICRAVFPCVRPMLGDEARNVSSQLPKDLQKLWNASPLARSAVGLSPEMAREQLVSDIERQALLPSGTRAEEAFAAVMCAFAMRLSGGEARHVNFALPAPLQPLVIHCLTHRDEAPTVFNRDQFISRLAVHLGTDPARAEQIARIVFDAVRGILPDEEIHDVSSQLPPELRDLWGADWSAPGN